MKAIVYCRKSTESEERQVQSLEAQLKWCREYTDTNSFEVIKEIVESKTAKKPWREWFNEMMQLFAENKADIIVTWQLNRLSRNPIDEWTLKWFTQQWIIKEIHSTDWISNWQNILLMSVHFGMANQYVIDLKKNVERWMKQKLEKGWICTRVPFWYINDKNTKTALIDENKAEWVKEIFKLRIQWLQYYEIWKELFKRWLKTKFWNPLSKTTIEQIIKNEFYIWIMNFSWEKYKWAHDTLISSKTYNEANKDRRRYSKVEHTFNNWFFIKEKIYYKWKKMSPYKQKWHVYYKQWFWIEESINIGQNDVLEAFEDHIKYYMLPSIVLWDLSTSIKKYTEDIYKENKKHYEKLKKSIEDIREKKSRLLDVRLSWLINDDEYKRKNNELVKIDIELEEELKNINYADTQISNEASELLELLSDMPNLYKKSTSEAKWLIINMVSSELILINKKELKVKENKLFEIIKNINMSVWLGM